MQRINRTLLIVILVIFIGYSLIFSALHMKATNAFNANGKKVILIDPGHGGVDGGASSSSGTLEKHIALEISLKLRDELKDLGYYVVMTREEDKGLYNQGSIKQKKIEDLNNRVKMKSETNCDAFISIHLNKFTQAQYFGAEVWYSNREDSKEMAALIMKYLKSGIDNGNKRTNKPAKGKYKVLRCNDNMPGVIVECGFLSNPNEEKLLKSEMYQTKLAMLIARGIDEYFNDK
ncbi:N-acetylmuramoyl-L-alanine amidase CwlD [Oceanirhabdus sp. W0125-5]|uniref:N-acetylmuramoyl-L-alanine amidase CwlD n=1 Tax=Oceanirhabdus sp. W0125-5 TaxID=2999116 RepID=UPI0022F2F605|nr:N-acetylmuramoyl-L-alanine amidase CwlD [Oceanirhabdus sp. W0125-5]WBW98030.1 N-acetylmuramoyl-L-alanine amidase CwlD [Oceanirhabdus sp. W0125-5]